MIQNPFHHLNSRALGVALFTKEDPAPNDDAIGAALSAHAVVALAQVHGGKAVLAREGCNRTVKADAVATDVPGLALTIRTADCQSFLVFAPKKRVAGLIHAGWRGLLAGIIPSFFDLLWEEWQITPEEALVCTGPSLCTACAAFTDPKRELPGVKPEFFQGNLVNLRGIAEDQLWNLGIPEDRFERMEDCTRCNPRTYWSYRGGDRDAVEQGQTNLLACTLRAAV